MRNFVTLDLSGYSNILIEHNGMAIPAVVSQFVHCVPGQNLLKITNISTVDLEVFEVKMFDIGASKLKFLGVVHHDQAAWKSTLIPGSATWQICYQAPVFDWLHKTLDLGILIRGIDGAMIQKS